MLLSWVLRRYHGSLMYWSFLLYWWRNLLLNLGLLGKLIKEIRGRYCWTSHIISSLCFCLRFLIKLLEELLTWCLLSCTFRKIATGILGLTASILLICFAWKQRLSIHCWLSLRLCLGYRLSFNWSLLEIVEHIIVFFSFWLRFWICNFVRQLLLLVLLLVVDFFLILLRLQIKILLLRWRLSLKVRLELIVATVIIEKGSCCWRILHTTLWIGIRLALITIEIYLLLDLILLILRVLMDLFIWGISEKRLSCTLDRRFAHFIQLILLWILRFWWLRKAFLV